MSRVILWFWYLVLIWCASFCVTTRLALAAEASKETIDSERKLGSMITDFFLNSEEDKSGIPTSELVTVISSRLPSFRTRLSDIPANVSYIPANVSYKSNSELEVEQPHFVQEAIRDVEGALFFDQVGNGLDTSFGLRGFSEGGAVVVLVDGVRVNEVDGGDVSYPLIPVHDIESIQIERGSASPIYGSGAFGGVVNIMTRRPSEKLFSAFGGVELSSFLGIRFNQGVSGSIPDRLTPLAGKFFYHFNGGRDLNDGFRDNGEWRITSFDVKTGYELPDEQGRVHVGVKHVENALSNPGALTLAEFEQNPEQTKTPLAGRDFNNTIVQIGADKKWWDDKIITSILADWRLTTLHFFTTSRTFADIFQPQFNPDTDRLAVKSHQRDLVWQAAYEDTWNWLGLKSEVGMEFNRAVQTDLEQDFFNGTLITSTATEEDQIAKLRSVALFWRETLRFWQKLFIHGGMRHDYHWFKVREQGAAVNNFDQRWNDATVSAGATLKPVEFMDIFGNYSQGFRVPDISDVAGSAEFGGSVSAGLLPEKSDSYEAGTRLRYRDLAQYKFSYFLIDIKDEIVFDSNAISITNPFGQNINLAKSRRTGIENRLDLNPIPELDLYGTFSWVEAFVRETDRDGSLKDGRSIGLVPMQRYTAGVILHPLARLGSPYDGFSVSFTGAYTGRQHVQSYQTASQANLNAGGHVIKPYTVWNFLTSFKWKGKRIYFKINNLFGEKYFSRAVIASNSAFTPSNITPPGTHLFVNPGAPREYLLGATWEFA